MLPVKTLAHCINLEMVKMLKEYLIRYIDDKPTSMLHMQYMSKTPFVFIMLNYSFCCNLLYHVGGHAGLGA
jgi:hypothetical protein